MSNCKKIAFVVLFVGFLFLEHNAQSVKPLPGPEPVPNTGSGEPRFWREDYFNRSNKNKPDPPSDASFNDFSKFIPSQPRISKEERARIGRIISPNREDIGKYKNFLRGKNTGLFRLFPDYGCKISKNVIRVDGECADLMSGSWNYTFRLKGYPTEDFLDLRLKNGDLISDGFLSQAILTRLGDVPLETVSTASDGVKFLFEFKPLTGFADAKRQYKEIATGIENGNFKYTKSVKAEVNQTYVLRVVAFRAQSDLKYRLSRRDARAGDSKFAYLNYLDKRVDIIVAFRVVRREEKGDLTILWKRLDERDAPKIIFARKENLSDIK